MITGRTVLARTNWRSCLLFGGFPTLLLMDWTGENISEKFSKRSFDLKKDTHDTNLCWKYLYPRRENHLLFSCLVYP